MIPHHLSGEFGVAASREAGAPYLPPCALWSLSNSLLCLVYCGCMRYENFTDGSASVDQVEQGYLSSGIRWFLGLFVGSEAFRSGWSRHGGLYCVLEVICIEHE